MKSWMFNEADEGPEFNNAYPNLIKAWTKALGLTKRFVHDGMVCWSCKPNYDPKKHICERTWRSLWHGRRAPKRITMWKFCRFFQELVPGRKITPIDIFPLDKRLTIGGKPLETMVGPQKSDLTRLSELEDVLKSYLEAEAQISHQGI